MTRDPDIWDDEETKAQLAAWRGRDREGGVQKVRDELGQLHGQVQDLLSEVAEAHLDTDPIMAIADAIVDAQAVWK